MASEKGVKFLVLDRSSPGIRRIDESAIGLTAVSASCTTMAATRSIRVGFLDRRGCGTRSFCPSRDTRYGFCRRNLGIECNADRP